MKFDEAMLDHLVEEIRCSAKYRHVCPVYIRRLGAGELANRPNLKTAVQETRSRLHQSAGAYLDSTPNYSRWLAELEGATDDDLRVLALKWMRSHASTRERLSIMEAIYSSILPTIAPVHSVIDIACGINPLALPWMGLPPDVRYDAVDLYADMMGFLEHYFMRLGLRGTATVGDAVAEPPMQQADLAIILKFLPVLEQNERGSTIPWLQRINARYLLVSFPTGSLGGKNRGMASNYESRFISALEPTGWAYRRFVFPTELCFLVNKVS